MGGGGLAVPHSLYTRHKERIHPKRGALTTPTESVFTLLVGKGFSLIPLDGKEAVEGKSWGHWSEKQRPYDPKEHDGNYGVACGPASNVIVLDVDNTEVFEELHKRVGLEIPDTFTVKTSNGIHFYLRYDSTCKNYSYKRNKKEVFSIRGNRQYVVAPGSVHPDTDELYQIIRDIEIAPCPEWFFKDLKTLLTKKVDTPTNPTSDRISSIDDMITIIREGQPNSGLHEATRNYAHGAINDGTAPAIVKATLRGLMQNYDLSDKRQLENYNKIEGVVDSAANKYTPTETFDDTRDGVISHAEVDSKDIKLEYIIEGIWTEGDALCLYGLGSTGKSLMIQQWSQYLALPKSGNIPISMYGKFRVPKQKTILHIQSENSLAAVHARSKIMSKSGNVFEESKNNIFYMTRNDEILVSGAISEYQMRERILRIVELVEERYKKKVDIIFFDPLISFHGAGENDNSEMRTTLDYITSICSDIKATPGIIHHARKDGDALRGASAIYDHFRYIYSLKTNDFTGKNQVHFSCDKSSNIEIIDPFYLDFNENLTFKPIDIDESTTSQRKNKEEIIVQVVEVLTENMGSMVRQDFLDVYCERFGVKKRSVDGHLNKAIKAGKVLRFDEKIESSGHRTTVYKLTKDEK